MKYFILISLLFSGCTISVSAEKPKAVDTEARQDIAQIKSLLQSLGPTLDKAIDEKIKAASKGKK